MNKQAHILFTATFSTPFIREDLSFLRKHFEVTEITSFGFLTFFKYLQVLPTTNVTFSWFASVYASILVFLTKLFHTKSVIVLGGVDVAKIPEAHYGIWTSWWKSIIVRYGLTHADIVLAVDESLKRDAIQLANYDGNNIHVLPTGYDADQWKPGRTKEQFVLTVAQCDSISRITIKGIQFLISVAETYHEHSFLLIGIKNEIAQKLNIPKNLHVIESVPQQELLEYYQRAAVYFQPSLREGLPNSLCEAMLCECFPIGTDVGGIPTAIGNTGLIIPYGDVAEAGIAIKNGFMSVNNLTAGERIATHFTKQRREELVIMHIESLIYAK